MGFRIGRSLKWCAGLLIGLALFLAAFISSAPYPRHRAERIFFSAVLSPIQKTFLGYRAPGRGVLYGFRFESEAALRDLRVAYDLDGVVAGATDDFEEAVLLMHWVRDQFPHRRPAQAPDDQAFDGLALLKNRKPGEGYLCGTAAALLVQALTAIGDRARRVELRFGYEDLHAVVEVWSETYRKWAVLDPDYDVYFLYQGVPQQAMELHAHWVANRVEAVEVQSRESPHNIYRKEKEGDLASREVLRKIYERGEFRLWDRERRARFPEAARNGRFAVKLLHYYTQISYPLRNDWKSRPLPWWHPEGNHVENSLVIAVSTMRRDEDFLLQTPSAEEFYRSPITP